MAVRRYSGVRAIVVDKIKSTKNDQDPHASALSQVEHDTAGQQERVHNAATRDTKAKEAKALKDDLAAPPEGRDKIAQDTARYEALVRDHGVDLNEEGFNEALRKVGRTKPI